MESYKTYHFEYEDGNRTEDRKLSSHVCNIRNSKGSRPMKAVCILAKSVSYRNMRKEMLTQLRMRYTQWEGY